MLSDLFGEAITQRQRVICIDSHDTDTHCPCELEYDANEKLQEGKAPLIGL